MPVQVCRMITHLVELQPGKKSTDRISIAPEFFPLPQRGHDPHLGLGRSSYYELEKRGLLRLIRVRKPGNVRGKVLIPFAEAVALIRSLAAESGVRK